MACSAAFSCISTVILLAWIVITADPWIPWAEPKPAIDAIQNFLPFESFRMFEHRALLWPLCEFGNRHQETVNQFFHRFDEYNAARHRVNGTNLYESSISGISNPYVLDQYQYINCISRQTFEEITCAFIILASCALFGAMISSCAICCNCCQNRCPSITMLVFMIMGMIFLFVAFIVYVAHFKAAFYGQMVLALGWYIALGSFLMLLVSILLGVVMMISTGDMVQYGPSQPTLFPPENNQGYPGVVFISGHQQANNRNGYQNRAFDPYNDKPGYNRFNYDQDDTPEPVMANKLTYDV